VDAPVFRKEIADGRPPAALLTGLADGGSPHLLDALGPAGWGTGPGEDGPGVGLLAVDPEVVFTGGLAALREARRWLAEVRAAEEHAAVLIGGIDYELGIELSGGRLPPARDPGAPSVRLAGFRAVYRYDWRTGAASVVGTSRPAVDGLVERLSSASPRRARPRNASPEWLAQRSDDSYRRAVERAKAYIRAGDVYQVNLSRRLEAPRPDARGLRSLFGSLASCAGAPFSAYLETPERTVLSASPERFLRVAGDRVETCPIKGTRPRGRTGAEDAQLRKELQASAKDRAEHVMIVDLERNDLGRVCRTGSVRVTRLCEPRSFSDVHHLVSTVEGGCAIRGLARAPEATFPGGSITGAPKLRAMQIIAELERAARPVHGRARCSTPPAAWICRSRSARPSRRRAAALQLGGGIVADSDPRRGAPRDPRQGPCVRAELGLRR
jgi:para-aminobenzoate synthetase component 1